MREQFAMAIVLIDVGAPTKHEVPVMKAISLVMFLAAVSTGGLALASSQVSMESSVSQVTSRSALLTARPMAQSTKGKSEKKQCLGRIYKCKGVTICGDSKGFSVGFPICGVTWKTPLGKGKSTVVNQAAAAGRNGLSAIGIRTSTKYPLGKGKSTVVNQAATAVHKAFGWVGARF